MNHESLTFLRHYLSLRQSQWKNTDALAAKRLALMLESARKTRYYGGKIPEGPCDISSIHPTGKEDVISRPRDFLTVPISSLMPARTSGSTGAHTTVYLDKETLVQRTAFRIFIESQFGRSPLDLAVQVHGSHSPPSLLSRFGIFRKKFLSVFESEEDNLKAIAASGASVIGSYASTLAVMALLNNMRKKPLRMKLAFSYGEMVGPETRALIEDSFSCRLFQLYGSTEFGPIAFECHEGGLHVDSSSFVVELVDAKNRPSERGELLITSLVNHAMPLLRYRIGDAASWGECSCGRSWPVLESIAGRNDDYAILPSGRMRSAFSFFGLYCVPGILAYQVIQETREMFVFRYVPGPSGFPQSSKDLVSEKLAAACLGEPIHVEFQEVGSLPKGSTGKRRHFISKVSKSSPAHV